MKHTFYQSYSCFIPMLTSFNIKHIYTNIIDSLSGIMINMIDFGYKCCPTTITLQHTLYQSLFNIYSILTSFHMNHIYTYRKQISYMVHT